MEIKKYTQDAVELLECLITKPSISRDEVLAAEVLQAQMEEWGLNPQRIGNNIVAYGHMDENRETLLLNAHIDTVKPVSTWTRDPYKPSIEDDRLYGLGANDCGGGLVSLLQVFRILSQDQDIPYNIIYVASAEEEVSGQNGFSMV